MNAKKAKVKRKIERQRFYVAYEIWRASEPPRYRFIKWRKWKNAEPKQKHQR